jgi:isopentenyl diphosphate isomerase/L-lactate dehydrogenase-like FMN-dependent dehydrogenase
MTAADEAGGLLTNGSVALAARAALPDSAWDRLVGGAESETTARRNRLALDCIALRPRVLAGSGDVDTSTTWLDLPLRMPLLLASVGDARELTPRGADATTAAAWGFGTIPFVGAAHATSQRLSGPAVIEIAAHDTDDVIDDNLALAERGGWAAVCVNMLPDALGRRERESVTIPAAAPRLRDVWRVAAHVVEHAAVPVIAKGVTNGDDARRAVDHGCRGIYVSNLGGRVLDHGQATIDALAGVVAAVDGRAETIVDGGFARATDIAKALAFGARAVAIGRLHGLGLAAGGEVGLRSVLENIEDELRITMALLGVDEVAGITTDQVIGGVPPVQIPHDTSAFFRSARRFRPCD